MEQFQSIDDYVRSFPVDVQRALEDIRRTIKAAAPGAEEVISYNMPAFTLNGERIVYFAAYKKHIGMYPPPRAFKKETARYAGPKGSLRFPLDSPMPLDLIGRIVASQAKETTKRKARGAK